MVFRICLLISQHLELKKDENTNYVLSCKSRRIYTFKLKPLYNTSSHRKKLSEYRMRMKFDKDPLILEQNNDTNKIVNAYIVYNLDAWAIIPLNNFKLKNCLFGSTNKIKIVIKKSGYIVVIE